MVVEEAIDSLVEIFDPGFFRDSSDHFLNVISDHFRLDVVLRSPFFIASKGRLPGALTSGALDICAVASVIAWLFDLYRRELLTSWAGKADV